LPLVVDATGSFKALDSDWLRAHAIRPPANGVDKNSRGRVLIIGGSVTVPGGLQLTAEAALRAGAGKVQVATVESASLPLGIALPEAAIFPLPENDGEILANPDLIASLVRACDVVVVGPAMSDAKAAGLLVDCLLTLSGQQTLVLDAAALLHLGERAERLRDTEVHVILTPHLGEMAAMLECDAADIESDRETMVRRAAHRFGATVILKGPTTLIATPMDEQMAYAGGGVGLATGGSGDVLAGIVAGLAARGAEPLLAAATGVWLHGEAGRRCGEEMGPIGFLARELLARIPRLMSAW